MRLLEAIKSLNPLTLLSRSPAARATSALRAGATLEEVMRVASEGIAKQAVREALDEFSDGPAALLITCVIEASAAGWDLLASQLLASHRLPREGSAWVAARMTDYGHSLAGDLMSQHLINLVLSMTGLHVEALVLTRADVDARRLTVKLAELLKQGLSSGVSRTHLAQTLNSSRTARRFATRLSGS